jgi:molybdopterin converting factor small subunit
MAVVKIRIYPPLSQRLGLAKVPGAVALEQEIGPGDNLHGLFRRLGEQSPTFRDTLLEPDTGALKKHVSLLVNGQRVITREDWQTPLQDGAEVVLLPAYAGG